MRTEAPPLLLPEFLWIPSPSRSSLLGMQGETMNAPGRNRTCARGLGKRSSRGRTLRASSGSYDFCLEIAIITAKRAFYRSRDFGAIRELVLPQNCHISIPGKALLVRERALSRATIDESAVLPSAFVQVTWDVRGLEPGLVNSEKCPCGWKRRASLLCYGRCSLNFHSR